MNIIINGYNAYLKEGTSIEYISENRDFSGSDGYTLTITFPLKGCPQNIAIFGYLFRPDVTPKKLVLDCEIRHGSFYRSGCITITEINETEVKTQFLDGRSAQNFEDPFDDVYINELDLGSTRYSEKNIVTPTTAWWFANNAQETCIPWVNDASGNIQNCAVYTPNENGQPGGTYSWHTDTKGLSWQIYLLEATIRICMAMGYQYNFDSWNNNNEYKYLLICNTLPYSWYMPEYAKALPHWTVKEYFEKLELFMGGEFEINHRDKTIVFQFTKDLLSGKPIVSLDNVVEEFSTEVKVEDADCQYNDAKNLAYKDCDHSMWKYYSCKWFIDAWQNDCIRFSSLSQILGQSSYLSTWNGSNMRSSLMNMMLWAADINTYFIIRAISRTDTGQRTHNGSVIVWQYKCILQPLNSFGARIIDESESATTDEIEFVPARIDYTDEDNGFCVYLPLSAYDNDDTVVGGSRPDYDWDNWAEEHNARFAQTGPDQSLAAGEKTKKCEYYDRIYLAWWDGSGDSSQPMPRPYIDEFWVSPNWDNYRLLPTPFRLNDSRSQRYQTAYQIEPTKKTTFKFLADEIPDVRALFLIKGKRYVCEKLTATFSERGMSQLIKGVFYPVKD